MSENVCIVCGKVDFTSLELIRNWVCDECYVEYAVNDNDTEWDFSIEKAVSSLKKGSEMPFFSEQEKKAKNTKGVDLTMSSIDEFFGNYLKSEQLMHDLIVTVKEVKVKFLGQEGNPERKLIVYFNGLPQELAEKGLALNKINAEAISETANSRDYTKWAGLKLCLYVDPNVMYGGKRVGGIRVRVPSQGVVE